jgi:hypothetical protein
MTRAAALVTVGLVHFLCAGSGAAEKDPAAGALRKKAVGWLKKNTRSDAQDMQLAEVISRVDKDLAAGQYFVLTLGRDLMKSGKACQVYAFAGKFFTFELSPRQAKKLGLEPAGLSYATANVPGQNRRDRRPLVKLGKPRLKSDRATGKITGTVMCRTLRRKAGEYGLRISYQAEGEWTVQLFPLRKLPKKQARLRFALDRVGKNPKSSRGPVVLFLDVCSVKQKDGQASFTVHSNTVAQLLDVPGPRKTQE